MLNLVFWWIFSLKKETIKQWTHYNLTRFSQQNCNKRPQSLRRVWNLLDGFMPSLPQLMCFCLLVSHLYGFGLLDAEGMVKEAEFWKPVPSQHKYVEEAASQMSRYHTNVTAKSLCFQSGVPIVLSLTIKYTSFSLFVALLVIPFLLSASSLISCVHNAALFLYSDCLVTELFILARCWHMSLRPWAAPSRPFSALFMWSTL